MKRFHAAAALLFAVNVGIQAETATTGDLGPNIITGAGAYTWSPSISASNGTTNGSLTVQYALWLPPVVSIQVLVNGTAVGSFLADVPSVIGVGSATFDLGGLLVDGVNTVTFDGGALSPSDYSINSVTVNYALVVPEPPPAVPVSTNNVSYTGRATVFHFLARAPLAGSEGSPVSGDLRLQFKRQKHSSLQKFDLRARGLGAGSNYVLVAVTATATNAAATLTADRHGRLSASYVDRGQGGGNGKGGGKNAFPAGLDPVTTVRAVGLIEGTNVIAWASVVDAGNHQFLVKRALSPTTPDGTAVGSVALKGNREGVSFRLGAGGLTVGQPYHLALNSTILGSFSADARGRVGFVGWPAAAPGLFDLKSISLLDGSGDAVLSATLP